MQASQQKSSDWIGGPVTDLVCFGFGWIPIFALFVLLERWGLRAFGWQPVLVFVLLVNFMHRHLTLPLIYADSEQFQRRRRTYLLLPFLCLALTVLTLLNFQPATLRSRPLSGAPRLAAGDTLVLQWTTASAARETRVAFDGSEADFSAVAARIQQAWGEAGTAKFQAGSLEISLAGLGLNSRESLRLPYGRSNRELASRLGLDTSLGKTVKPERPWFSLLLFFSVAWTIYHTVMQKMGILRVYSRKAGYGEAWLDKGILYSWFIYLFFQLAALPRVQQQVESLSAAGKILNVLLRPMLPVMPYLAVAALLVALAITGLYLRTEFRQGKRFHWPKNLFVLSVVLLYATFFYDFLAGYTVFGFSHAIEYMAFVNLFTRRKYLTRPAVSSPLASWIRRQAWYFGCFAVGMTLIFLPWRLLSNTTLTWYIVGSSFLHFLYDGWIWKVRDPQVAKPLGIGVEAVPSLPAA